MRALGEALARLAEALELDVSSHLIIRDGTIQRFEFCVELLWKTLRKFLEVEGEIVVTPRQALQGAYKVGWIDDEQLWLNMLKDRNLTSHTYKQDLAELIYANIRTYYPAMHQLYELLLKRYGNPR